MAGLTDPTVTVVYQCGCTLEDTTPLDGIQVPERKTPDGETIPAHTLAKRVAFRFGADETTVFRKLQQARQQAKDGTLDRDDLVRHVERILGRKLTAAQANRVKNATAAQLKQRLYDELLEDRASPPARVKDPETGVTFPQPPGRCPRHGESALHTHTSYLSPADPPKADRTETGLAESTVEGAKP